MSHPEVRNSFVRSLAALTALALSTAACEGRDEGPRAPLSQLGSQPAAAGSATTTGAPQGIPVDSLNADAREALTRGNEAMRAKRHREALAAYRAAAAAAPHNAAPYFGIQMAARALGDSAVADSAARRIRVLSPGETDKADPHTLPPGHP